MDRLSRVERALGLVVALLGSTPLACAPRPHLCRAATECGASASCVAGRCQVEGANVKPAIDVARRLVVHPTDVGYASSGPSRDGLAPQVAVGRNGGRLFLRFDVAIPEAASVVEAYVVLERSSRVDDAPAPVLIHAARVIDRWRGGTIAWGLQPRSQEVRAPTTTIEPAASPLVRVDVRELVRHWLRRDPSDEGIVLLAEGDGTATFTLSDGDGDFEPYLEIYLR